jgi:hypothetical protein
MSNKQRYQNILLSTILKMKIYHFFIVTLCMCIPMMCSAITVIEPEGFCGESTCPTPGYEWSFGQYGSTLTITSPGEYAFANVEFPDEFYIDVSARDVTLDGEGVTLIGIDGDPTLNLTNINIFQKNKYFTGISSCNNIENSSIVVVSDGDGFKPLFGIKYLYGNIDDTTTITVTGSNHDSVFGIYDVSGTISGGTFTVTSQQGQAHGVYGVRGTISGGTFTVTSQQDKAYGVLVVYGTVSGGTFTITSKGNLSAGIKYILLYGEVSGGTFTVNGERKDLRV